MTTDGCAVKAQEFRRSAACRLRDERISYIVVDTVWQTCRLLRAPKPRGEKGNMSQELCRGRKLPVRQEHPGLCQSAQLTSASGSSMRVPCSVDETSGALSVFLCIRPPLSQSPSACVSLPLQYARVSSHPLAQMPSLVRRQWRRFALYLRVGRGKKE